jgi:hypothetical protein
VVLDRHREHQRPARHDAAPADEQSGASPVGDRLAAVDRGGALDAAAQQQPPAWCGAVPAGRHGERERQRCRLPAHGAEYDEREIHTAK